MTDEAPTTHPHARIADILGTHVDVARPPACGRRFGLQLRLRRSSCEPRR